MAELGNVAPAISVEGWQEETDARRGAGVYAKVLDGMANLRRHGVPFGISVTATTHNVDTVMSDAFMDFFFDEIGATFGWVFQYMPIGRSYTVDLMVTPEQRKRMLERELELIFEKDRFLLDFWNGGPLSVGCIAAGRAGGYFYIDWNGNCSPCVFFPYGIKNLYEMYEKGETISAVLETEYFKTLRRVADRLQWKRSQGEGAESLHALSHTGSSPLRAGRDQRNPVQPMDDDAAAALGDRSTRPYDPVQQGRGKAARPDVGRPRDENRVGFRDGADSLHRPFQVRRTAPCASHSSNRNRRSTRIIFTERCRFSGISFSGPFSTGRSRGTGIQGEYRSCVRRTVGPVAPLRGIRRRGRYHRGDSYGSSRIPDSGCDQAPVSG